MTLARLIFPRTRGKAILFASLVLFVSGASAQNAESASPSGATTGRTDQKTAVSENGTQRITQTQETERKVTSDGEVEIQRFRSPSWPGDESLTWEREVRTKNLPDGTVEKEYVVNNPDGANHLTPVQIIRERIKRDKDSTIVEREMLQPDYEGHWQALQKETVTEKGPDTAKETIKDVQQPDTTGAWQVVERQITSSHSSAAGKEVQSVRKVPDAHGGLADYERRGERILNQAGMETHEVTLQRRDFSDTDAPQFYLVERTTTQSAPTSSGTTLRHIVTESDLLPDSPMRNFEARHAGVVEERTEEERIAPDGTRQTVTTVNEKTAGDPSAVHPAYKMIQQKDRNGYVRQIFIPAQ